MKNIIALIAVILGVHFISSGKNFDLNNLNALPGMPVLHGDEGCQPYNSQNMAYDTSINRIFNQIMPDSIQSYIKQLQRFGHRYMISSGQKNISLWLQQKQVTISYNAANHDSLQLSYSLPNGRGTIRIELKNNHNFYFPQLLAAHKPPQIILQPGKYGKIVPIRNAPKVKDKVLGNEWMGGFAKNISSCFAPIDIFDHLFAMIDGIIPPYPLWMESRNHSFNNDSGKRIV